MKSILLSILSISLLSGSTWQNIQSPTETQTVLSVQEGNVDRTVLEFNIDGFHLIPVDTPDGIMFLARLQDGASILEKGAPDMHKYSRSIIIPDNKKMGVKVLASDYVEYNNILIAPSKGNITRNINPSDIPYEFGNVYSKDIFYPDNVVDLADPYILRDARGQSVVFYPIHYNPVQKILRVYKKIEIEVYSKGPGFLNVLNRNSSQSIMSKEYQNIYKNHFINYTNDNRFDYLVDHGNMLIISYGSFMATVQPLVDWKNKKGISTEMVNVSEIGSSSSAISSYVDNYYNTNGLTFLLLIGDIAQIPSPSIGGSASDPSYGFIDGNDSYAEVIVGRFSGSTPAQIGTQVERSIDYERYPQSGLGSEWYDNALGVASNQGPGFGGYTDDDFNDFLWETVLSDFTYDSYEGIYDGSGGTATQGINAINNGVSLINYTGHGSISSWGNGAPLSTSNVNSLTNNNLLPFVITVGCNVGEFNSTNECYAEAWLRATNNGEPTGAISHFGSTISQSWEPPMHGQYGMNLILTESYDINLTRTMGGITTNGCMYMNDAQGSSGINETNYWTYFGDPTVPIRTAPPTNMSIVHDDVIIIASTEFIVDTGNDGDLIALSRNDELLASGYTENGILVLSLGDAATVPGELDLVATGFNNFPYETTVMVLSPDGAYVMVNGSSVSAGFDDMIEYGESVGLSLTLENVGNDAASDLMVDISTDDAYISIVSSSASTSYIAPNGVATVDGFAFDVAGNVPNNHNFEINCTISSGSDVWESALNFIAYAPVLDVTSVVGDLDPGQTTDMMVTMINNGGTQVTYPVVSVAGDSYVTINYSSFSNAYSVEVDMEATLEMNVTVSSSAPIGHLAEFTVTTLANLGEGPTTTTTFFVPVGQVTANFEAGFGSLDWDLSCSGGLGCANWDVDNMEANFGSSSAKSGIIGDSQSSDMSVTLDITADGEIEFYYKVSAEYSTSGSYFYDGLEFYIDNTLKGQYQTTASGTSPWTHASHDVTAGEHTFTWSYVKDGGGGSTDCVNTDCADAAWVDDIIFPPAYMESDVVPGDLNGDSIVNILDVVAMVNIILGVQPETPSADLNGDGLINILDVVQMINLILGGPRFDNASKVQLFDSGSKVTIESDGYVGAIKMILEHDGYFNLDLTEYAFLSQSHTIRNSTTLLIVAPETDHLFSYEGSFKILAVEAANSTDFIETILPYRTTLNNVYPNPFNPSTTISFDLSNKGNINLSIFNLSGQLVQTLITGENDIGNYEMIWDASLQPSGMYLLRLETEKEIHTQKLLLIK